MNEQQGLLSPKLPWQSGAMEKQAAAKQATTNAPAATAAPAVSTCLTRNTFDNGAVKFRGVRLSCTIRSSTIGVASELTRCCRASTC